MALRLLLVAGLLVFSGSAVAKPIAAGSIRTRVFLTADEPYSTQLKSCIYRNLRQLREITVVENNDSYNSFLIYVVVVENKNSFQTIGFSASLVIARPMSISDIQLLASQYGKEHEAQVLPFYRTFSTPLGINVLSSPTLDQLCSSIVSAFDAGPLEEARQTLQRLPR